MPSGGDPKRAIVAGRTGPRIVTGGNALLQLLLLAAALALPALRADAAAAALRIVAIASLGVSLVVLALVDARTRTLPRRIVRPMYAGGLAYALLTVQLRFPGDAEMLAGQVASSLVMGTIAAGCLVVLSTLMGRIGGPGTQGAASGGARPSPDARAVDDGAPADAVVSGDPPVGAGDIRLVLALGIALDGGLLPVLLVACIGSCAYALAFRRRSFPFGPFLAVPALAVLCAGASLGLP
ncbi:MAG: hypothetical protein ACOYIP_00400 [Coriobacteriales bacterium]|jgi:prepilin signal peptidase PulO-like enzyme (type II secretory pathway)